MNITARPHDLLWLRHDRALVGITEAWVAELWHCQQPVVVRRDVMQQGLIPVGVRGQARQQRAAGWVAPADVVRVISPEMLVVPPQLNHHPTVQALVVLRQHNWPWEWGVTGSTGFALATGLPVLHQDSDLDLLIRAATPLRPADVSRWQQALSTLPCRADTQIETPFGGFALNEWLRSGRVLLKTAQGPRLTDNPWAEEMP
ncbi:malonate decarboxylase holo-ACP synthase [Pantoea sp. At-9b]|uniref:malonate decarboxylase holo-ACP synthase n=1 Tax=Pantoea sp. (strain At-9b) TaxID=592316 RepID=UPI0001B3EE0D|nr:malonate decarboxylase holo-ACP synthase [Pantoea sp. At-9b]ADU71998.1 holo-ACP synthase, malonate decarboxylase-specific [Pantoea sp. At-9b]